jgi:hypothetical protein
VAPIPRPASTTVYVVDLLWNIVRRAEYLTAYARLVHSDKGALPVGIVRRMKRLENALGRLHEYWNP